MSRVSSLSVLCASHNMIGWYLHFRLWRCIWLYDKLFSALTYPSACLCSCVWFSPFCDDHQFIDVSKCEKPSWSTEEWWLCYVARLGWFPLLGFFLGYAPCIDLSFNLNLITVGFYTLSCIGIMACLRISFYKFLDIFKEWFYFPNLCS